MPNPQKTPFVFLLMAPCRRLQFNLSDLYPVPRLGIAALSGYLKSNGFENVEIRDIIAEREWIPELLDRFRRLGAPDVLGISVTILSMREAFEIARAVKVEFPGTTVVVGGPGVGFDAGALVRYGECVDVFVRGEGEAPFLEIVRSVAAGARDFSEVAGTAGRRSDGSIFDNPAGPYRNLDDDIEADYNALPNHLYRLHPPMGIYPPATMIETARGCTFPCEFCCLSMPVRYQSPETIANRVDRLKRTLAVREIHFIDPTFTLNRERTLAILELLEPLNIRWTCKTRVDRIDDELAGRMARAGCYLIAFGVESGDDLILGAVQKKALAGQAIDTFATCRKYGIRTTAYLLVGNPEETDESVDRTIRFVRQLRPDYVLYDILMADPINPLTGRMIEAGVFDQDDLERYYLTDGHSRLHDVSMTGLPMDVARARLKRASTDFYVRPSYFVERIKDLRTIQDARNLGAGGVAFFKDLVGSGRLWGLGN